MITSLARLAPLASIVVFAAACGSSSSDDGLLTGDGTDPGGGSAGGQQPGTGGGDGTGGATAGGGGSSGGGGGLFFDASPGTTVNPDSGCLTTTSKGNRMPANLMLQLDLSGSMKCRPTENAMPGARCVSAAEPADSRWRILRGALIQALDSIPDDASLGLMHYPGSNSCVSTTPDVAMAPLSQNRSDLVSRLQALKPVGGTPTHDAAVAAYTALAKSGVTGNKYIVLATDGQANYCVGCNDGKSCHLDVDNQQFIDQVADAFAKDGTRLFVIGVPGSEGYRAVLSRLAEAGGTAQAGCTSGDIKTSPGVGDCHYDMTTNPANFGEAIAKALAAISGQLLSCTYDIPPSDAGNFDPGRVNVQLTKDGSTSAILRDTTKKDGWDYSSDGKHIELYGAACDQVKKSSGGQLDIIYGCPTSEVR